MSIKKQDRYPAFFFSFPYPQKSAREGAKLQLGSSLLNPISKTPTLVLGPVRHLVLEAVEGFFLFVDSAGKQIAQGIDSPS